MSRAEGTNKSGATLDLRASRAARDKALGGLPRIEQINGAVARKAMRHVEQHLTEKIVSRHLAEMAKVTPEHFCRTFKQSTGMCLLEYVARLRIANACQALNASDELVNHVAFTCGFRSVAQFNKRFKKITGLSPSAYRAQAKF